MHTCKTESSYQMLSFIAIWLSLIIYTQERLQVFLKKLPNQMPQNFWQLPIHNKV